MASSSLILGLYLLLLLIFSNAVTSISPSPESNPKQLTAPDTKVRGRKEINYVKSNIGVQKLGTIDVDREELGGGGAKVGGRKEIRDVKSNKEVQDLGKFCVDEFNKNHQTHIAFSEVVKAESQVVAGVKYYLKIEAVEDGVKKAYDAAVVVKPWLNSKELLSFTPSH
ncbi:hypothetical protein MRB53_001848 [Persea americana]|uniref:Uncharacterized protein n=1 Tax=Persea americana TaxID=3435 RepID=A0ACC2MT45_PERAE|nr:hypothetical protein MRB53_001848 [Persea americana]|eukprot:TRINITY_DN728_c0_g1_i1.p1 TRINITY_DN728_c0_g1~~TRINITY_DN728_c0_g1_i1.p1  ORF type:complete len:168 (-),score=54.91 TRINITY_DN728_c0_g1_i1:190-693(-)